MSRLKNRLWPIGDEVVLAKSRSATEFQSQNEDEPRMHDRFCSSSDPAGSLKKSIDTAQYAEQFEESYIENQVRLFGPERYESRYEYPLIVWLHSCNSSEHEIESIMPELSLQNYVACAPRGTKACDPEGKLFCWGQSAACSAIAEEIVFESIEYAQSKFSIAQNRIFLAGFGLGGTMAWRLGLQYPGRFAGVVSICGDFPHRNRPLSNIASARDFPTLWQYGAEGTRCGIQQVCESLPVLHSASLAVDIRQYPCGNELLANMLDDMNNWVMQHVTNQPAGVEITAEESFSRN